MQILYEHQNTNKFCTASLQGNLNIVSFLFVTSARYAVIIFTFGGSDIEMLCNCSFTITCFHNKCIFNIGLERSWLNMKSKMFFSFGHVFCEKGHFCRASQIKYTYITLISNTIYLIYDMG